MKSRKSASIVLGIFLLASPFIASAQTTSAQTQIDALLRQIAELTALIAQMQSKPTDSNSCVNLSYNLYSGSTDANTSGDVTKLQKFLGINPTGYFGSLTERAVQTWQASHGIVSSGSPHTTGYGSVGAKTKKAMGCTSAVVVPPPVSIVPYVDEAQCAAWENCVPSPSR